LSHALRDGGFGEVVVEGGSIHAVSSELYQVIGDWELVINKSDSRRDGQAIKGVSLFYICLGAFPCCPPPPPIDENGKRPDRT
jgi:hypothetical protein